MKKFNEQFNHRFELGQRSLDNISNDIKTYIKTLIAEMSDEMCEIKIDKGEAKSEDLTTVYCQGQEYGYNLAVKDFKAIVDKYLKLI